MKKILKVIMHCIIIFFVFYNVILGVQKIKHPDKIPDFLGYKNFVILSGSMAPVLNVGDIIFVKYNKEIKKDDIISFKEDNAVVTHRVIDIIKENKNVYYKTQGDANTVEDKKLIIKENIEGVFCFKIPKIGLIITFFQSEFGIMIFLIIFFILYCILNKNTNEEK